MLDQGQIVRSMVGLASERRATAALVRQVRSAVTGRMTAGRWAHHKNAVWVRARAHRRAIGVVVSATVGAGLLVSDAVPGVLAPLVVGPVLATMMTLVVDGARPSRRRERR